MSNIDTYYASSVLKGMQKENKPEASPLYTTRGSIKKQTNTKTNKTKNKK